MTREIKLTVNDEPISLDYFVQAFIDHTTNGMLSALEGTGEIKTAEISIDGDMVNVTVNKAPVEVNAFVAKILRNTINGMISPLKGVNEVKKLHLHVKR
jgi:hypothetical protein